MGIKGIKTDRVILPARKNRILTIPNSNELIVIPDNTFEPVVLNVSCLCDFSSLNISVHEYGRMISAWLNSEDFSPLVFSDDADYTYQAILTNEIRITELRDRRKNVLELEFTCKPLQVRG